jgi:hypothetical protein
MRQDITPNVRKRVISIMRDLCISQPTYTRVPEIYAKLLGRMDDSDDGVRVSCDAHCCCN